MNTITGTLVDHVLPNRPSASWALDRYDPLIAEDTEPILNQPRNEEPFTFDAFLLLDFWRGRLRTGGLCFL
jgi:hypothetical protein